MLAAIKNKEELMLPLEIMRSYHQKQGRTNACGSGYYALVWAFS